MRRTFRARMKTRELIEERFQMARHISSMIEARNDLDISVCRLAKDEERDRGGITETCASNVDL